MHGQSKQGNERWRVQRRPGPAGEEPRRGIHEAVASKDDRDHVATPVALEAAKEHAAKLGQIADEEFEYAPQ